MTPSCWASASSTTRKQQQNIAAISRKHKEIKICVKIVFYTQNLSPETAPPQLPFANQIPTLLQVAQQGGSPKNWR